MSRLSATCGITSRRSILIALFAAFSLVGPLGSVRADITPTGDVEPDPSTLGSYTTVYIGNTASGTLTVDSGSNLLSGSGCIGNGSTATGLVNLTGSGSGWTINGDLCVGNSGSGTLSIASGGSVASGVGGGSSSIGANFGSTGIAKIDGLGSAWTIADNLLIGNYGSGTLSVSGGGSLTPTNPGGTTTVSISGTSLLSIDTGRGSSMAIAGGTGTFTNNGTIRILAGAGIRRTASNTHLSWPDHGAAPAPIRQSAERGTQPATSLQRRASLWARPARRFRLTWPPYSGRLSPTTGPAGQTGRSGRVFLPPAAQRTSPSPPRP